MKSIRNYLGGAALALALCSLHSPAAADKYVDRLEAMEKESAEPSRMTIYAKAAALNPPPFDEGANRTAVIALAEPFSQDLSFLKNYAEEYDPPAKLFYDAMSVKTYKHFVYTAPSDPAPNSHVLQNIARYLVLKSQADAKAGLMDIAIDDVAAVWLAGYSFETTNDSVPGNVIGMSLRVMAIDQMSSLLEQQTLNIAQQTRMIALITKQPKPISSQVDIFLADIATWPAMLKSDKLPEEKVKEAADIMTAVVKPLRDLDYRKQKAKFGEIEKAREKVEDIIGEDQVMPVGDILTRKAVVDAKQAVLLTGFCVNAANTRSPVGKASNDEITAIATPIKDYLRDPFTGESPRVSNGGNGKLLVTSAGPDGVFNDKEMVPYSSRLGLMSGGDIYLQKKGNVEANAK